MLGSTFGEVTRVHVAECGTVAQLAPMTEESSRRRASPSSHVHPTAPHAAEVVPYFRDRACHADFRLYGAHR